jgi:ribosomal protein S18 acetylase RimI-like enzyme
MNDNYNVEIINQRNDAYELIWNHNKEIERAISDEELKRGIEKFIDKGNVIAVIKEEKIIVFMVLYCNSYDTLEAYICNLYVLEQYRRNHLADKMIKKAIKICEENHFVTIHLHVSEDNEPAVALYKKHGFSFTEEYRNAERGMKLRLVK